MNTLAICSLAAAFLTHHLPPLERPVAPCQGDVIVTATGDDTFTVSSPMPRPWSVSMWSTGKITGATFGGKAITP
jgi:hypothetical protein